MGLLPFFGGESTFRALGRCGQYGDDVTGGVENRRGIDNREILVSLSLCRREPVGLVGTRPPSTLT